MAEYIFYTSSFDHVTKVNIFDSQTRSIRCADSIEIPYGTYLTLNPKGNRLYVGSEVFGGVGYITTIDTSDPVSVRVLCKISSEDEGPAYLSVSEDERYLLTCSYFSGTIVVYPLDADGRPGPVVYREQLGTYGDAFPKGTFGQAVPRCHCIRQFPGTDYVFVTDYSGDRLLIYRLSEQGILEIVSTYDTEKGGAIRHIEWNPIYPEMMYVNTEFTGKIYALRFDLQSGTIIETDCYQIEQFQDACLCANLRCSPDGKYLYNTSRKKECLTVVKLEEQGTCLSYVGDIPDVGYIRDFIIDPEGKILLTGNQSDNYIGMFHINHQNGMCAPLANRLEMKSPACFAFHG